MNKSLRLCYELGIPLNDVIKMSSSTPANILNLKKFGRIKEGFVADLVLIDFNFNVKYTLD